MRVVIVRMMMVVRVVTISASPPYKLSDPTGDQHHSQQRNQCVAQRLEVSRRALRLAQRQLQNLHGCGDGDNSRQPLAQ